MDASMSCRSHPHYHIRWSTADALDWQSFETREEADALARDLLRPHETYSV